MSCMVLDNEIINGTTNISRWLPILKLTDSLAKPQFHLLKYKEASVKSSVLSKVTFDTIFPSPRVAQSQERWLLDYTITLSTGQLQIQGNGCIQSSRKGVEEELEIAVACPQARVLNKEKLCLKLERMALGEALELSSFCNERLAAFSEVLGPLISIDTYITHISSQIWTYA